MYCYVRDCPNGPNSLKKKKDSDLVKLFPVPEDKNLLEKWKRVVPKSENVLSSKDKLCDSHFLPSEILWFTETKLPNGNVRRLLRDEPILRPDTIPSIFPAEKLEKENATFPIKEKQDTPKPIVKNVPSVLVKERSATPKGIVKNTVVKEKIETPKSNIRIRFKDPVESSGKRNPQRVKRRSTILDDYWTDDELNQVHNPGASKSGSAKKRKTESGPVIRLVPLECLMDKTTPKSKTPVKPIVGNRPSTEEIDHELKKVIEIPLLTRVKPSKSMTIRSTKETVQFKPPKRNVSKTKMKIMPHSETLISHDLVTAGHSVGFNEVKTETPDIEEELARMEMDEENEDVKCSDIVIMNPISIGEDESVVVKSEEEDDGYSVNEMRENPTLMNFSEGDEIPTIKSESEEELPAVEVASYDNSDNELANGNDSVCVPAIEAVTGSEQGSAALLAENSDSIPTLHEQSNELPEVPADVEQNKNVEEHVANETELVEKSSAVEAKDAHNNISCDEGAKESEVAKTVEEKVLEERVFEGKETDITPESGKEGDETGVATEAAREEANAALLEADPVRQESESAMDVENKKLLPENIAEVTKPVENEEILKPVESQEIPRPVENEEISKPDESDGTSTEEVVKPVESEVSQAALEETKETTGDGKDCGKDHVVSDSAVAGTTNESEPSGAELEKSISEDTDKVLNEDGSRPDDVNLDLPEAGDEPDSVIANENEKGETITDLTTNDVPPKPDDNVIDISDSEEVEADKEPTREASHEADGVIDVDLADSVPSSSDSITGEQSSGSPEPEKEDDESAMETEDGEDSANAQSADIVDDDEGHSDASPAADDDEVAEVEKNTENGKRDGRPGVQSEIDEMDIEAEVARLVSEVEDTAEDSHSKEIDQEAEGDVSNSPKQKGKESADKETGQPQEIVLQDTTNLGGITAAGVQNLFSPETIQEILKQIKLPLTTPVTFRIAPLATALATSSSSSGRGRGRKKGSRGMRGTNRHVVPRASSSNDTSNNSIDLFRHLTRTRTVFDFPTFVTDVDDDIQYWKLCQILKESFHELIETRNTKTSIGKLTLRVALNRPKKPKVQQNNEEPGPQ